MKPLSLFLSLLFFQFASAQYCGHIGNPSGPTQCVSSGLVTQQGLHPLPDSLPSLVNGFPSPTVIQIKNFDTLRFGGQLLTVQKMGIDSIGNLPDGLCWATDQADNEFLNQEDGCIRISGITCALPGQYRLKLIGTFCVGPMPTCVSIQTDFGAAGLYYYLRVRNAGDAEVAIDTTGQGANTNIFVPYGIAADCAAPDSMAGISGKVYFDANQNQVWDSLEQPVRNQAVFVGGERALTNSSGDYIAYLRTGTYSVRPSLSGNLAAFPIMPDSIVVTIDSVGINYGNNDFGVVAPSNFCESSLAIVSTNPPPRPGFTNTIRLRFINIISTTPVSQTIEMTYDARQTFVSANLTPSLVDTVNHLLTWNLSNIPSGTTWEAIVTLSTPVSVTNGTVLQMNALVSSTTCASPDSPLQADEQVTVVGSYDPNDKAVSPVGVEPGGRIPSSTSKLNYIIRFQNTGTFLAENINIKDTISPLLDIATLKVEAASHNYEVLISGREVTFRFSQINLPDSNSNEPASHGYIKYSIKPTSGFVHGSVITNRADIYFDFNAPVLTNTIQNRADNFISITETAGESAMLQVYPNPLSSGSWQLSVDEKLIGKELRVYDATGKMVYAARVVNQQSWIDASSFAPGIYLLRLNGSALRLVKL